MPTDLGSRQTFSHSPPATRTLTAPRGAIARDQPRDEYPPSTRIAAPVTNADAALARNTATPAKSSMVPHRPVGDLASTRSCRPGTSARALRVRSVSTQPGNTAFTWMLSFAQAIARDLVSCTMPPLLAPYTGANDAPKIDMIDPMLMTFPPPTPFMCGYA